MRVQSLAIEISRPHWWRRALIALVSLDALLAVALPVFGSRLRDAQITDLWLLVFAGVWICAALFGVATGVPALGRENGGWLGNILVTDDVLTVKARFAHLAVPRSRIVASALTQHEDDLDLALVLDDGSRIDARTSNLELGQQLVEALGVQPEKRAIELRIARHESWLVRALLGIVLIACASFALAATVADVSALWTARWDTVFGMTALATFGWVFTLAALRALDSTKVRIGGDGISVREQFFPFADTRVSAYGDRVQIVHGVPTVVIRASSPREASAVAQRARAARGATTEARRSGLARSGRDVATWREHLCGLMDDARAYRSELTIEELVAAVGDPSEEPEARVGAAVALAEDETQRPRLRDAIVATANPRLRIALERAARGTLDDETLLAATKDAQS